MTVYVSASLISAYNDARAQFAMDDDSQESADSLNDAMAAIEAATGHSFAVINGATVVSVPDGDYPNGGQSLVGLTFNCSALDQRLADMARSAEAENAIIADQIERTAKIAERYCEAGTDGVVLYAGDASTFCRIHASERWGNLNGLDHEGNSIGAIFSWDDLTDLYCDGCVAEAIAERSAANSDDSAILKSLLTSANQRAETPPNGGAYVVFAGMAGCLPDYTSAPLDSLSDARAEIDWYVSDDAEWIVSDDKLSATRLVNQIWVEFITSDELAMYSDDDQ